MRLPSFRHIFKADFKEEFQDMIERLSVSLNNGIEVLYDALNGKLSLSDNLYCNINTVDVNVDSNGFPKSTTGYSLTLKSKPIGLQVLEARNTTNSETYPSSGIFISFTAENSKVIIDHVTGLQPDNVYRLRIITWG